MTTITLEQYQKEGVKFLRDNKKCILSDETGLGKTIQGLQTIKEHGGKVLLICPKKLCNGWIDVADKFGLKCARLYASEDHADADLLIINYASINKYADEIKKSGVKAAMLDEAHYLQNRNSSRTKAVEKLLRDFEYKWLLTATPIWNKLDAVWSLLHILDRKQFGSYWRFVNTYCIVVRTLFGTEIKGTRPDKVAEVQKLLKNFVLVRRKEDVLTLPPTDEEIVWLNIDKRWKKENVHLRKTIKEETGFSNRGRARVHLLDREEFMFDEYEEMFPGVYMPPAKKQALFDIIHEEAGKKIIVVTKYQDSSSIVHKWLSGPSLANFYLNAVPIDGSVKIADREKMVKEFQDHDGTAVLLGTIETLGTGLNLHCATVLVFVEHPDIYAQYMQTIGRITRHGTTKAQKIYHLVQKGTLDERYYVRCMDSGNEFNAVMDGL